MNLIVHSIRRRSGSHNLLMFTTVIKGRLVGVSRLRPGWLRSNNSFCERKERVKRVFFNRNRRIEIFSTGVCLAAWTVELTKPARIF